MDPWHTLRTFTQARIGQGSAGSAQRTDSLIDFQLAHAEARDAVWKEWDCNGFLIQAKEQWGEALLLNSQAQTRTIYLKRPDLGRRLSTESLETLTACYTQRYDIALIISNGLSTTAVETHALPFLSILSESLIGCGFRTSPVLIVPNGRVALSDEIGTTMKSRVSLILIGERPGLSAADSLGAYLTLSPAHGNTDAERNCLSNIREPGGLDYRTAADKICYLTLKGLRLGVGGVSLKDDSPDDPALLGQALRLLASGEMPS